MDIILNLTFLTHISTPDCFIFTKYCCHAVLTFLTYLTHFTMDLRFLGFSYLTFTHITAPLCFRYLKYCRHTVLTCLYLCDSYFYGFLILVNILFNLTLLTLITTPACIRSSQYSCHVLPTSASTLTSTLAEVSSISDFSNHPSPPAPTTNPKN